MSESNELIASTLAHHINTHAELVREAVQEMNESLALGQDVMVTSMGKLLDVVVGPVKTDWAGVLDPDGDRDDTKGLMAQQAETASTVRALDYHMNNGGVPTKTPLSIKLAIWTAAGTGLAALINGLFKIVD